MTDIYDTLVVGGGPAGLTAALHLAWHGRKTLVLDRVSGPLFFTLEKPAPARWLLALGQAGWRANPRLPTACTPLRMPIGRAG